MTARVVILTIVEVNEGQKGKYPVITGKVRMSDHGPTKKYERTEVLSDVKTLGQLLIVDQQIHYPWHY